MNTIVIDVYSFLVTLDKSENKLEILEKLLLVLKVNTDLLIYEGLIIDSKWNKKDLKRLNRILKDDKLINEIYRVKYNFISDNLSYFYH